MKKVTTLLLFLTIAIPLVGNAQEAGTGNHFKINVPQAGMLKQRLENAVLDNSDYDVVDSLTVKGKFGGEDLAYLVKSEGILSELTFLDLSEVELVYDDEPYATHTYQLNGGTFGGIQIFQTDIYTLSKENKEEDDSGNFSGALLNKTTYYRRNDFEKAFNEHKMLTDCRLPKSLKGIGEDIFNGCEALEKVTLPNNSTYVGNNAFKETALKTIELPTSVEKVGDYAFERVPIENIDLSHVRSFGKGCFVGAGIKNIQLADGMESIPDEMFKWCQGLTEVVFPGSVKTIGKNAFEGCGNLSTVTISGTITTIEDEAFMDCSQLKSVTMEEGVKKMGAKLFKNCWALENVSLPSTIEETGHHIFPSDWLANTSLPFENGIWYIGKVAYALEIEPWSEDVKEGLTNLNFKEGTVTIADYFQNNAKESESTTIYGLDQIKTISLPSTLRRIGSYSLRGSSVSSITLPDALEHIGDGALGDSKKLRRITIPENVKYIGTRAFSGCGITRVYYNAIEADVYKWVDVNGTVQYNYGNYYSIFADCPLVRVYIGEGVKKIPATLFNDCFSLARVQMASTVEYIGEQAFANCTALEHIDLPSSLKEIDNSALPIANLKSVACYMKEPINLGSSDEDIFAHVIDEGGATVYDVWQEELANGEVYLYGTFYPQTPLGSATGYYRIDAKGKISWGYFETFNSYYLGSEVLEDAEVVRLWQEAMDRGEEYYYGTWYEQTERVGDVECYYRIDANKNVSFGYWKDGEFKIDKHNMMWTDKVPKTEYGHIALLQVPKGQLSAYQSNPLWTALVDKIEALDVASDVEPVNQTMTVTVSESVKEYTNLSNTMMGNIFVTLDVEDSGDGYNAQEGCIVINSTTSEEGLAAATAENAEDLTVKNLYNGLIMEVPGGKGKVVIDCQTLGQNVIYVKIGDAAPQKINTDSRQQLSVPYDIENDSHVYIYAAKVSSESSSYSSRAAYPNDDAVKLYGLTVQIDSKNAITGDVNGDGVVNGTDIQAIINLIVAGEYDAKADVNGDGTINGTDIQEVINIIVEGE